MGAVIGQQANDLPGEDHGGLIAAGGQTVPHQLERRAAGRAALQHELLQGGESQRTLVQTASPCADIPEVSCIGQTHPAWSPDGR